MSARKRKHLKSGATREASGAVSSGRLLAIRAMLTVALACSAYLAYLSLTGGRAVGCGPDSGCDKVLASRWGYWFGIPVSVLALVVDATFLGATLRIGGTIAVPQQRQAWTVAVPCAALVAGAAVWFIVLQLAVLRSICPYCMTAHAAGLIAALLTLASTPIRPLPAKPWELQSLVFITPATLRKITIAAAVGIAFLVVGQLVHQPQTFVVQQIPDLSGTNNSPKGNPPILVANPAPPPGSTATPATGVASVAISGSSTAPTPAPPGTSLVVTAATPVPRAASQRLFPVYNGRFEIDVADVPTIGAATNAQVMVALHDYTCHHCRLMHPILAEAQHTFSNQLVVVTLPMPFDPTCNPLMQRPNPNHTNACEYARLSLALWRADRAKHHVYEEYLFTGEHAPPVPEARQSAIQLIGADTLEKALSDPWVEQHLRLGIALYETAYRAGQGAMPQFIIGRNVAVGTLPKANLMELLAGNLGLTTPQPAPTQ